MKIRHALVKLLLSTAALAALPAFSQQVTPSTDPVVQAFAQHEGLTTQEADRRLRLRIAAGEELARILDGMPDRFAGKSFTENPMIVTVRLTGTEPVPSRTMSTVYGTITYRFTVGATHSLTQLKQIVKSGKVAELFPEHQGIMIDGQRGVIVVELPSTDFERIYVDEEKNARRVLSAPIELKKSSGRSKLLSAPQTRAGGRAVSNNSYCTFGFRAYDSDEKPGLITAAHCLPTLRYEPIPGSGDTATVVLDVDPDRRRFDAGHDVQWHPVPASSGFEASWTTFTKLNGFNTIGYLGKVRPDLLRETLEGLLVLCRAGTRTGYSCGTLTSVNAEPESNTCNFQSCTSDWIKVEDLAGPYDLLCDAGDSGGPLVSVDLDAVAIVTSAKTNGSEIGDCDYLIGMSLAKVHSAIGVTVR